MLSRLIYILMVKASNSFRDTPRKEEFHAILRAMNTLCCGLTSILWRSQILEVIEISLNNLVSLDNSSKINTLIEGHMLFFFFASLCVHMAFV